MKRVKELRTLVRLSQAELGILLAYHLGESRPIAQTTISKIESGSVDPSLEILIALAKTFKCDVTDLVAKTGLPDYVEFDGTSTLKL